VGRNCQGAVTRSAARADRRLVG